MGAMAGTVDMIQRCYTGIEIRDNVLWLNPRLPKELSRLRMPLRYRGHWLRLDIRGERLTVRFDTGWSSPVRIGVLDSVCLIRQGEEQTFDLTPARVGADAG
jgi:trehalose/maltose hydrolase-like predicted phosphorylase